MRNLLLSTHKTRLRKVLRKALHSLTLIVFYACTSSCAPANGYSEETFTLNLDNTDIFALIDAVSKSTGKNFIVDPRVAANVTVISNSPVNASELYDMFLSVLQVHGFSAIPIDGIIKIVPDNTAKQGSIPVGNDVADSTDQMVSQVLPVSNVNAAQLAAVLRPMVPDEAHLEAYAATNSLVITDRASNIQRLLKIIKLIDKPDNDQIDVVTLKHVSASNIVETLSVIQPADIDDGYGVQVTHLVAEERTNSLLIGGSLAFRDRIRGLVQLLDVPIKSGGNTRVVFLNFAKANDMANILRGLSAEHSGKQTSEQAPEKSPDSQASQEPQEESSDHTSLASSQSFNSDQESRLEVQSDPNTNSLIINAPPDEMQNALAIIRELDIRRPQVMVEAVIAEITEDNTRELGLNFLLNGTNKGGPAGYTNLGGSTGRLLDSVNSLQGQRLPSLEGGVSFALGNFARDNFDFGLLLKAISADAENNILSTPTIVTLDNQEAEIIVGSNVPFVTGTQLSSNNDNPFQTIERKDIGLTLKVTPQISKGDTIQLELQQEVSSLNTTAVAGASDITTNKRALSTTVLVENGQTLVLGGLIDDQTQEVVEKVPLLGDIPGIGRLFQHRKTSKRKRNLVIFLRPQILRSTGAANEITAARYKKMQSRLTATEQGEGSSESIDQPEIPPLNLALNRNRKVTTTTTSTAQRRRSIEQSLLQLENSKHEWIELPDGSTRLNLK